MDDSIVLYHCMNVVRDACIEKEIKSVETASKPLKKELLTLLLIRGVPRGDAQDARASPLSPLCIPPRPCASPLSPA
jgi:hypothetical protein